MKESLLVTVLYLQILWLVKHASMKIESSKWMIQAINSVEIHAKLENILILYMLLSRSFVKFLSGFSLSKKKEHLCQI